MAESALRLYHRMPPGMRSAFASLRGLYLRCWRYSPESERLVAEARDRETWSAAQWKAYQEERLALLLHRAAQRIPYYRAQWARRRRGGDRASWEYLENWPILDKEPLRQHPLAFVADDRTPRFLFPLHTSGTTGTPLRVWQSRQTLRQWYALFEARYRRWHGVSRHDAWAILGGQLVTPVEERRPPFWVWNAALHQLYMSTQHLAPDLIPHYLDAIRRYKVRYLWGYSSALEALARGALASGSEMPPLEVVLSNAEPLYDYQRQLIREAFGAPVRETYGMTEIAAAASECEQGRMHVWPDLGIWELLEDGGAVPLGEAGDLVATGLINVDMPLIRYRTGDRATLCPGDAVCACGRTLPLLQSLEGRTDDVLYTRDGRRIGRLDPVFKDDLPLREVQVVQTGLDRVVVRCVPAPGFETSHGHLIVERLQARMGPVEVTLEELTRIPRGANGKFRAVICQLPESERRAVVGPGL